MAMDPGVRTGVKLVCLDAQGTLLHHEVIYPAHSVKMVAEAAATVKDLCHRYRIEAIAIGNPKFPRYCNEAGGMTPS